MFSQQMARALHQLHWMIYEKTSQSRVQLSRWTHYRTQFMQQFGGFDSVWMPMVATSNTYVTRPTTTLINHSLLLFIHSFCSLTIRPQRLHHRVRSSVSSFNFQSPLISLTSPSSCLHPLRRLPVTPILPSITYFRRQFLHINKI